MKKQLGSSRIIFNKETLDINLICNSPVFNEVWFTFHYSDDHWSQLIRQFTNEEINETINSLSGLDAVKVVKKAFSMTLPEAVARVKGIRPDIKLFG